MDDKLKELMQELGNAINESLSDSDRIGAAIVEIKRAGYDVFLVLEATIGFNKIDEADREGDESDTVNKYSEDAGTTRSEQRQSRQSEVNQSQILWTAQDYKFLKALKILDTDDEK